MRTLSRTYGTSCAPGPTNSCPWWEAGTTASRPRFADAIRASGITGASSGLDLSQSDLAVLAAIAYLQPLTRRELAGVFGVEVNHDPSHACAGPI